MCSARNRPAATGTMGSPQAWITVVGTVMLDRMGRTSIARFRCMISRAIFGVQALRSKRATRRRTPAASGAFWMKLPNASPLPHPVAMRWRIASQVAASIPTG